MIRSRLKGRIIVGILCACAILLVGCQTNEGRQARVARKAATSLDQTTQELVKADQEVNQVLAAIDQLASQPRDLKQAYRAFTTEVSDSQEQSEEARERAEEMRDQWREYITTWEQEIDRITTPELQAGAAERRQAVRENYGNIRDAARKLQAAYEPFIRQLQDIQRSLAFDLTPAGVEATKPAFELARQTGAELKQQIDTFISELNDISTRRTARPTDAKQTTESEQATDQ